MIDFEKTLILSGIVVGALLGIAMMFTAGWDRPPLVADQLGFRGLGMEDVVNPRTDAKERAALEIPESLDPADASGPRASEVYENVKLLGDLSEDQFLRLMTSITEWVSPEEGCGYCHNEENLASDEKYTKGVSLRMIEMTRNINAEWGDHVKQTGVTCYTCHRGKPVPERIWFKDEGPKMAAGFAANRNNQNMASKVVGSTSLPFDPFSRFLAGGEDGEAQIGVNSLEALPSGNEQHIKDAEWTYGLMMHFSQALGANCTYCHNSRIFSDWDQSPPARLQASAGIDMVRELNSEYLTPLTSSFPENRLGPHGDVAKVNCATCHQGVVKPLYGAEMAKDYPTLQGK